ncbi:MAG: DUF4173 domain-containing protein [Bacteroidia bacterium]|nr:DUF4173 domain-containing protein [Bacteroidia bacterium]
MKHIKIPLLFSLLVLYQFLFWGEKSGLNILLFTLALGFALAWTHPGWLRSRPALITAAGTLLAALLVVFNNSAAASVVHICSALAFLGFAQETELRSLHSALGTFLGNLFKAPITSMGKFLSQPRLGPVLRPALPYLRISLFPLVVVTIFFCIFMMANQRFSELTLLLGENFGQWVQNLLQNFNLAWVGFILAGVLFLLGIIFPGGVKRFLKEDLSASNEIVRVRKVKNFASPVGLRKEYRAALMLLIMVNLLLLVVNLVDISWIWIGFVVPDNFNLSQFVHEGTYLLILSILLSMGIMLFFFRANQNFYPKSKLLRMGAYAWIIQNVFLTLSVALRNYYYIDHHGLAYKRIGVIFFLALVIFGLISLFLKIRDKKSGWFLVRTNSWAVYGVMLLLALFNWDILIAKYNLNHTTDKDIDVAFLMSLSDKALPVLYQHREVFSNEKVVDYRTQRGQLDELFWRISGFNQSQKEYSWVSWNLSDQRTAAYFEANGFRNEEFSCAK